jgi:CRISPR-associated endonuclease Csn1
MVSRMPQRKVSGAIHEETIRSAKRLESDGLSYVRKALTSLKETDLKNLVDPEHNEKLYAAMRRRMAEHNNDGKKAFAEPLRKPTNEGLPGPIVKSVKVYQQQNSGISVRGGIADNGDMVRTDVFRKDGKYYLVPIYVSEIMSGRLPNKAIASGKSHAAWPVINDSYEFLFSLYPYDLVLLKTGKEDYLGYYRGCDISSGLIKISKPNKNDDRERPGAKTAVNIQKYEMGILGDCYPVRREVRRGLENSRHLESGATQS